MTGRIRAYLTGTLALDLNGLTPALSALVERAKTALTLQRRLHPIGYEPVPFWMQTGSWLYIPRGWALTDGEWLLPYLEFQDGRSAGRPLPAWSRVQGVTLGAPPYPKDQPAFVKALIAGSTASGIGGVGLAPTRSGKTICAVVAAINLGLCTLVVVDNVELLRQWKKTFEQYVVTGAGSPIRVGVIRGKQFEIDAPVVVSTVQTLARRKLTEDHRRAFGTIILDECQGAPCEQIWSVLLRFDASCVLGLTATPRRSDGLGKAIGWMCGPHIATLERKVEADVLFLRWPYRKCKVPKVRKSDNTHYMGAPRLMTYGSVNRIEAAKAMFADPEFAPWLASHIHVGVMDGRQVLVMVELRANVEQLAAACRAVGLVPGIYMGTMEHDAARFAMRQNPCIATIKKAGKGIDFQPPPTMTFLAAAVSDPEQITGRGLQPQVDCKPLLVDVVVGAKPLVKQAYRRLGHYRSRGFDVLNEPWVGDAA